MNGEKSCVKNLDLLNDKLDQYENEILGKNTNPGEEDIQQYLNMSIENLTKIDANQASIIANKIAQYSLYIQRLTNKENGIIKWCDAVINKFVANRWDRYSDYIKSDIKINIIIKDDEAMQEVLKIKNNATQRKERLNMIPSTLKYLFDTMIEIARSKRCQT